MPLSVQDFRSIAGTTNYGSRDIVVGADGNVSIGKIGRSSISKNDKVLNANTMSAFRNALKESFGTLGEHAFDTVLGTRMQLGKSLRKSDVEKTVSQLESVKLMHLKNEIARLVGADPRALSRGQEFVDMVVGGRSDWQLTGLAENCDCSLDSIKAAAARYVETKIKVFDQLNPDAPKNAVAAPGVGGEVNVAPTDPTGLLRLDEVAFNSSETSVEDRVKSGQIGVGMRVNLQSESPLLFEKLKTNGVEPGFIVRKDWSAADTRSLMADALTVGAEMGVNGSAAEILRHGSRQGAGHPASMAFTAETIMMRDLGRPETPLGAAFAAKFPGMTADELFPADMAAASADRADKLKNVKEELFAQIRDAVMAEQDTKNLPLCKRFAERHIVKLDYNEGDRGLISRCRTGSAGKMRLPERCSVKGGAFKGFFFHKFRLTTGDKASAGAVAEAFANDLTRLAGIPAQELSIVRGSYSDGHTKLMLQAKFADGYKDLEDGFIKDGRINSFGVESLGRYKAMFLLLADRDAIGSHGQNKGFKDGRFFAIDPGHSLEGNGKDLEIHDDLSFVDKSVNLFEKRFKNFSVFDDSTHFEKFQGVLDLRNLKNSNKIEQLYNDYCSKFKNPPEADKELSKMVLTRLESMKKELDSQMAKILNAFEPHLKFYDAMMAGIETQNQVDETISINGKQRGVIRMDGKSPVVTEATKRYIGECAIETIANLEKATSPITWMSANGEVALRHLEVLQETRIPWSATYENGNIVYTNTKPLPPDAKTLLSSLLWRQGQNNVLAFDEKTGQARIVLTPENRMRFFEAFRENEVIQVKRNIWQ
jgi:hypothetical protein